MQKTPHNQEYGPKEALHGSSSRQLTLKKNLADTVRDRRTDQEVGAQNVFAQSENSTRTWDP